MFIKIKIEFIVYLSFIILIANFKCVSQIRNEQKIKEDIHFKYKNSEFEKIDPSIIIKQINVNIDNNYADDILIKNKKKFSKKKIELNYDKKNDLLHDKALAYIKLLKIDNAERLLLLNLLQKPFYLPFFKILSRLYYLLEEESLLNEFYTDFLKSNYLSKNDLFNIAKNFYYEGRHLEALNLVKILDSTCFNSEKNICFEQASLWLGEYYLSIPNNKLAYYYFQKVFKSYNNKNSVLSAQAGQTAQLALWGLARLSLISNQYKQSEWLINKIIKNYSYDKKKSESEIDYIEKIPSIVDLNFLLAKTFYNNKNYNKALKYINKISYNNYNSEMYLYYGKIILSLDYKYDLNKIFLKEKNQNKLILLKNIYGKFYDYDYKNEEFNNLQNSVIF